MYLIQLLEILSYLEQEVNRQSVNYTYQQAKNHAVKE